jgi:hypothetical protein
MFIEPEDRHPPFFALRPESRYRGMKKVDEVR